MPVALQWDMEPMGWLREVEFKRLYAPERCLQNSLQLAKLTLGLLMGLLLFPLALLLYHDIVFLLIVVAVPPMPTYDGHGTNKAVVTISYHCKNERPYVGRALGFTVFFGPSNSSLEPLGSEDFSN